MTTQKIQLRRGTAADLPTGGTIAGEPRFTTDTGLLYVDDGTDNILIGGTNITPPATIGTVGQVLTVNTSATASEWAASPATIMDAQGAMLYASAANTLAKLATGAANLKLFVNASATAPEWASGVKIGAFTRAMDAESGDVAYTGVGFKPSAMILLGSVPNIVGGISIGFTDGTNHYCISQYPDTYAKATQNSTMSIALNETGSNTQTVSLKTFNADGFTLSWHKNNSPTSATAYVFYMAFR